MAGMSQTPSGASRRRLRSWPVAVALLLSSAASPAAAQTPTTTGTPAGQDPVRLRLPTVTVTAQKEPEDKQKLPVSVTAVSAETIRSAGIVFVSDAAIYAPNTYFTEFTARKLSTARFRGVSSSPGNPGITTFIDGVPQFNTNSSSMELIDVDQIEFVRGPQSALFGRNTLGGLINITSGRPTSGAWTGRVELPIANHGGVTARGTVSGGIVPERLSASASFAHASRNGYTTNAITGNDLDERAAFSGKGQLLWTPESAWEARLIVSGERARDGDYGLHDLDALRQAPFQAARDFEGRTDRGIFSTTVQARRTGSSLVITSTTGIVRWTTEDATDLDYTPFSLVTRTNAEKDIQFTQEVRAATAENAALALSNRASLHWQAGLFVFTQRYDQRATNRFTAGAVQPFAFSQTSPLAELDDAGLGLYGQGTVTLDERLALTAGLRIDYESKTANLQSFFDPAIAPPALVDADRSFSNVSPQLAATYQVRSDTMAYATFGGGFKAGGFNPASPAGLEAYDEEHTWLLEGGVKRSWADGRMTTNASLFYLVWNDLQLNVPDLTLPSQFYISNVAGARSKGLELEVSARAAPGLDVFGAFGNTSAHFASRSVSNGVSVDGNRLANTPSYTFSAGAEYSRSLNQAATVYGRAEMAVYGAFQYDDANTRQQDAYSLANLRAGVRGANLFVEGWMRNAFDTRYIPVAFAYPGFAPSGFVGEMGPPRVFGITGGVRF